MKRLIFTLAILLLTTAVQAKPVDPAVLLRGAQRVLNRADVIDVTPASFTACRLFTGSDGMGFVLLASDDCVRPLLGYATDEAFPTEGIPEHVMAWIDAYQRDIEYAVAIGVDQTPRAAAEWQWLLGARGKAVTTAVKPLLKTKWNQSPYYNNLCPYDSAGNKHCVTGCVATAAAQVMRYWKHPAVGRGSHSYVHDKYGTLSAVFDTMHYEWNKMPNSLDMASQAQVNAVAQLMYHAGVAVDMTYGPNASGAHTNPLGNIKRFSSETSLKEFFRYNPSLFTGYKEGYTDAAWRAMIDEDLDSLRPILYDGYGSSGGHAFVLDGRDTMGLYHFNWGWGGSANGYFTLDSLAPVSNATFSTLNSAVFHIYPIELNEATATINVVSSNPSRGTVSGSGTYSVDSMRVLLLATAKPGYRFDHWLSGNPANPIITSPTNDISDTAVFVPIHRDSVGYCRDNGIAYKNLTDEDSVEWGIRIPFDYLEGKQRLREVHFWTYEPAGPYYLHLYRGVTPDDSAPFYTDSLSAFGYGMNIYTIPESLAIDFTDTTPLWVTIYAKGSPFPISYSHFTGTVDGSWVRYNGVWQPMYEALHVYGSWMLRALLDPSTHVGVVDVVTGSPMDVCVVGRSVSVQAESPVALYDVMGRRLQASSTGMLRCTLPAAGVYIVRAGATSKKIVVF